DENYSKDTPSELYIKHFKVAGQGTVGLQFHAKERFQIVLNCDKKSSCGEKDVIVLDVGKEVTYFRKRNNNDESSILKSTVERKALLDDKKVQLYWLSLDKKNRRLRYGKGPMQNQLTVFSYDFPQKVPQKKSQEIEDYKWIENLKYIAVCCKSISKDDFEGEKPTIKVLFWRLPVTMDLPPFIIRHEDATLEELETGKVTVIDNLPKKCQELYWNVVDITLNTPDFPDFADAIDHSIKTPGLICNKKLKEKASGFGDPNPKATYLRITLGEDKGNSPGVPYVLEIWPSGHYSPIHSHSNSFAVIKVLYNEIVTRYFAGLDPEEKKWYYQVSFQEGEITWISDKFYQTHQLVNRTRKMCATIQCYQYRNSDNDHYEFFDYIDKKDGIKHFKPNSDWHFTEFKNLIKEEWKQYKYISDCDLSVR
ncbi:14919_t:CDS:1, partial [Dentiscutata erythropus]